MYDLTPKAAARLLAVALGVVAFYTFNHVLRSVCLVFDRSAAPPGLDGLLIGTTTLVGVSAAALLHRGHLWTESMLWPVLISAWLAVLVGYLVRIDTVRKHLRRMYSAGGQEREPSRMHLTSKNIPDALSGVRRMLRTMRMS